MSDSFLPWQNSPPEPLRPGGFIQGESGGFRSREQIVLQGGAGLLNVGTVLGKITVGAAAGKYVPSPLTASDGSQAAIAVLFEQTDTTDGDVIGLVIARNAEVRAADLTYDPSVMLSPMDDQWQKWAQLASVDIVVRT